MIITTQAFQVLCDLCGAAACARLSQDDARKQAGVEGFVAVAEKHLCGACKTTTTTATPVE
jgi:hypothetical protein